MDASLPHMCRQMDEALLAADTLHTQAQRLKAALRAASQAVADGSDAKTEQDALQRAGWDFAEAFLALKSPASQLLNGYTPQGSPLERIAELSRKVDSTSFGEQLTLAAADLLACPGARGSVSFDQQDAPAEPVLSVPTRTGTLRATYFGDPGEYDGIAVDIIRPDGKSTQCALVECSPDSKLHTLCWDGKSEEAVREQEIDPDGEYWW